MAVTGLYCYYISYYPTEYMTVSMIIIYYISTPNLSGPRLGELRGHAGSVSARADSGVDRAARIGTFDPRWLRLRSRPKVRHTCLTHLFDGASLSGLLVRVISTSPEGRSTAKLNDNSGLFLDSGHIR